MEGEENKGALWFRLLFPLPFTVLGGLIVLQALGYGQFVGRALVPNWVLGMAGLVFLLGGVAFYIKFFGGSDWVVGWFGNLFVLALAAVFLYVTGALPWIGTKIGVNLGGGPPVAVTQGILEIRQHEKRVALPLSAYAGRWETRMNMFGAGWVTRLEVRVDGDKVRANLWRACPPNHCDSGWFEAKKIEAAKDGMAYAVHFAGQKDGMDWVVSLRGALGQGGGVMLDERHIRGKDWNTHSQQAPMLRRAP